ncbi:hypothetical protein H257_07622 [Aphanomyces astaci]|uniref:Uncharacterized protein n=1 Tax=Aphanomyces astaci TaxID=112090 RepID=W4GGH1_APHAT|nr:hypothetical protein H257_07622 [Aphanomyces astaci]ETV78792.1 hypothetical protein H257_07622 [Aphanomyces astaci]|eukprot:XP_009831511.1 hypothetical protein H257_07622 [Aphanomyces astaci]
MARATDIHEVPTRQSQTRTPGDKEVPWPKAKKKRETKHNVTDQ